MTIYHELVSLVVQAFGILRPQLTQSEAIYSFYQLLDHLFL